MKEIKMHIKSQKQDLLQVKESQKQYSEMTCNKFPFIQRQYHQLFLSFIIKLRMTDFKIQKDCITTCQPTNKNQLPKSKNNSDYWFKQKRPTNKLNRLSDTDKRTLLIVAIQKKRKGQESQPRLFFLSFSL